MRFQLCKSTIYIFGFAPVFQEFRRVCPIVPLAQNKNDFFAIACGYIQMHLKCGAWVPFRRNPSPEIPARQPLGPA
jgi:hypothetical protein